MYITMHCGGLPFNGDTIKTKSLGGSESAAYYLARELVIAGHHVILFTNSTATGMFDGVKYEWAGNITEQHPLGERFSFYAENTPHDICIIQRHPHAFSRKLASKQNFLWLHDLALLRVKDAVIGQMWNVDALLCVSEYHKKQINEVWGVPLDRIAVMNNAVDRTLYDTAAEVPMEARVRHLIYSSRPERGLIELVKPNGIMDRLKDEAVHLHVCGYENTTEQMKDFYEYLWGRCEELPNVTNHGALTKQELANLQISCDAWVYPTTFEEVSCITAMEAMVAGLPAIVSDVAALPETCKNSGTTLIPLRDGAPDVDVFCAAINEDNPLVWEIAKEAQFVASKKFTWANSVAQLMAVVYKTFTSAANPLSLAHHFMRHSDIKPFELLELKRGASLFAENLLDEYREGYAFYRDNTYGKHYADYYQYEKDRGINYGPEDVSGTSRFQTVANLVAELPAGSRVLDYGCAHGHYTVALATRFPQLVFVGADLAQSNIDAASKWAEDAKLNNVTFIKINGFVDTHDLQRFNAIIAAEVIEHVGNPLEYVDGLAWNLTENGRMIITTPYGPWEAQGYREHEYWRAHLHHFERADIVEAFGHHPNFKIVVAPAGRSIFSSPLGSYIYTFTKPVEASRAINYLRKTIQTMPDQTISCCMIAKNAASDIQRCLKSVLPHVQEVVIGIDKTTTDETRRQVLEIARANPLVTFNVFDVQSPLETGFDVARNTTIQKASCDWILWIDADEVLVRGNVIAQFTRNSMYNGFAVKQHHFSHDPVDVIKVDLPCRLFRNHLGIQFFGKVHEHPEIKMNEGLGPVMLLPGVDIVHHGYHDEGVRRRRFDRNLPLLKRDRLENPERILGKFLWLRDLAQTCQYESESRTGLRAVFEQRAAEGVKLWEELLDTKNYRLVLDALPYYSQLAAIRGHGFEFSFSLDASKHGRASSETTNTIRGYFDSKEHALRLMSELFADKTASFDRRYQ